MKIHVYIATTQGLVTIQNITPIDDPDISSVVSINGTSTTANISGSYHNFVKKGVGIIQQMFGACSYRADISARIDQGNSWQLAMYLGHLAHSKGLLGNGEVKPGDSVICATGEVNTSNHTVLAVNAVSVKLKLAEAQIQQWIALGASVAFLIPQANQDEVSAPANCIFVEHLEQAATFLSDKTQGQAKPASEQPVPVSRLRQKRVFLSIGVMTFALIYSLYAFNFRGVDNTALVADERNIEQKDIAKSTSLVATLKQSQTCEQTSNESLKLITKMAFAELSLPSLCDLALHTAPKVKQVLLIAKDAYTVLPLTQDQLRWQIPLPKNRLSDRPYFLVTLASPLSQATIEQLRLYRETMANPSLLGRPELNQWLEKQNSQYVIYSHKLLVK